MHWIGKTGGKSLAAPGFFSFFLSSFGVVGVSVYDPSGHVSWSRGGVWIQRCTILGLEASQRHCGLHFSSSSFCFDDTRRHRLAHFYFFQTPRVACSWSNRHHVHKQHVSPLVPVLRSKCVMETARREVPRASRNLDSRSAPAHASRTTQRTLVQPRAPVPALLAAVSLTVFSTKAKGPATIIPSYRHPYRPTLDESHLGHPAPVAATTHNGQPTKTLHGRLSSTARR